MDPAVHCGSIYDSQDKEATCVHGQMKGRRAACTHGVPRPHGEGNEASAETGTDRETATLSDASQTGKCNACGVTCVKSKRTDTNERIHKAQTDSEIEKRNLQLPKWRVGQG